MRGVLASLALAASSLALAGCGLLRSAAATPGRITDAVLPESAPAPPSPEELFADLIRWADLLVLRVDTATREFTRADKSDEAELQAASWRLDSLRWATQLASGPSSTNGLLDLLVVVTSFQWVLEDHWIPAVWGEAARPLEEAIRSVEAEGWGLLERYLEPQHVSATRAILTEWRAKQPAFSPESLLAFPNFLAVSERVDDSRGGQSLLGAVGLDPLASLEPTARAIERSRVVAQKALFYLQRAPRLVTAEIELRTLQLRGSDEARQLLADVARVSAGVEGFAATAAGLPAALGAEREAAVAQISTELVAQREGLVADLQSSERALAPLLDSTRATLATAHETALALTETVRTLDAFIGGFRAEEEGGAAAAPAHAAEPAGKPFDVTDYGTAAERLGVAAHELTVLVQELDRSLPAVQHLLDESTARGERLVDRAVARVLVAGLVLIAAATIAGVLSRRWRTRTETPG